MRYHCEGMETKPLEARLIDWLRQRLGAAGAEGFVVGLSGGIDSAVTAALCRQAAPGRTLALIMPCHSDPQDAEDARLVAATFGLETRVIPLDEPYDTMIRCLEGEGAENAWGDAGRRRVAGANVKPRLRMIALYYLANRLNYLVVGTGNRSELYAGYFTKYGDGGVDLLPLGNLVKTQVRELARRLGVPGRIIEKPPSAGLWSGQTDEGEMGLRYDDLDRYILTGEARPDLRERMEASHRRAGHKLRLPPMPDP